MARHDLVVAKQIQQIHKFTGMAIGGDLCENCAYTLWRQGGRAPTRRRRGLVARRLSHKRDDLATLPRSFGRSQNAFFWGRLRDLNVGQPVSQSKVPHSPHKPQNLLCCRSFPQLVSFGLAMLNA